MKLNMDHMIVANYIVIDSRKARSNRARARAQQAQEHDRASKLNTNPSHDVTAVCLSAPEYGGRISTRRGVSNTRLARLPQSGV